MSSTGAQQPNSTPFPDPTASHLADENPPAHQSMVSGHPSATYQQPSQFATGGFLLQPQPNRRHSKRWLFVLAGVLLALVVAAFGIFYVVRTPVQVDSLAVGNCVSADDFRHGMPDRLHATSCNERDAVYELAEKTAVNGTCPDGKLDGTSYFTLADRKDLLCFAPNVREGECYRIDLERHEISPRNCSDNTPPGKAMRVYKRIDGSADRSLCAASVAIVTPKPARVVCLGR